LGAVAIFCLCSVVKFAIGSFLINFLGESSIAGISRSEQEPESMFHFTGVAPWLGDLSARAAMQKIQPG